MLYEKNKKKIAEKDAKREADWKAKILAKKEAIETRRMEKINSSKGQLVLETLNIIVDILISNKTNKLLNYLPDDKEIQLGREYHCKKYYRQALISSLNYLERNHPLYKSNFLEFAKKNIDTKSIQIKINETSIIVADRPDYDTDEYSSVSFDKWKFVFDLHDDSTLLINSIEY